MKVRFIGSAGRTGDGERKAHGFLTPGKDYVVLSIIVESAQGVQFLILDDSLHQPGWHSAEAFDLVSDEVPSNWSIKVGEGGSTSYVEIAPSAWLEPNFYNAYWGDGDAAAVAAQAVFDREVEVIVRESS